MVLDESQAAALDAQSGDLGYSAATIRTHTARPDQIAKGAEGRRTTIGGHDDSGGASRFFYTAKAPGTERVKLKRESGGGAGTIGNGRCAKCGKSRISGTRCKCPEKDWLPDEATGHISHPTVKPLDLMRWLVRLVTPPSGVVLDPFAGSGTTVEACILEGFRCTAIEREADYLPLVMQRVHRRIDPVAAVSGSGEDMGLFDLLDEEPA